ncbi:RNA polymerase sigma factor [uncultured Oscillibacter sp.]|uniref:RNA polymerase sigma factor n=1 Tax=uncultured Oscillibacter sp. TaxID=876091 RepID=UPI0025FBA491|nr:RNA polymerase sigma factor [uncultured Oscillibacter sp.]
MTTKDSFSELVVRYERLVYTICFQLVRDAAAAEDLTQDTFLSAYLHRDAMPAGYERQWLGRIATNKAKDHLQSAWNRHTVLPGDEGMPPGLAPATEELALQRTGAAEIEAAVEALKEPYRPVCRLCLLEERSPEEAALALGRPVKTIHTQLSRGKKLLRERLERSGIHGNLPR